MIPSDFSDEDNRVNLKLEIEKLKEVDDTLRSKDDRITIHSNEEEISTIFENYNAFERVLQDLEGILNIFLKEINLTMNLPLVINDTNTLLFLKTNFL